MRFHNWPHLKLSDKGIKIKHSASSTIPQHGDQRSSAITQPEAATWKDLFNGKSAIYLFTLLGGVTLYAVNIYIVITIMPSVIQDIGGLHLYAWSTTLFVVASILGAALSAKLLQARGPAGAYIIASLLFAAGTLLCALAFSMPMMLIGRSFQGLGGDFYML